MGGRLASRTDGRTDRRTDTRTHGRTDHGHTDGHTHGHTHTRTDTRTETERHGCRQGGMDAWMHGCMYRRISYSRHLTVGPQDVPWVLLRGIRWVHGVLWDRSAVFCSVVAYFGLGCAQLVIAAPQRPMIVGAPFTCSTPAIRDLPTGMHQPCRSLWRALGEFFGLSQISTFF